MDRLYLLMLGGSPILGGLLGSMALTLLVGRLTRRQYRSLRLLPLGLLAIPLIVAGDQYLTKTLFWKLGALYSAAVGGAIFLGWLIGWGFCLRKGA